ncbi:hypothetical protein CAF53_08770 [Sphingobium sp. LB126]|nr:hypothetical protein CAF53_08770 [Sphingobium sp. LB126]
MKDNPSSRFANLSEVLRGQISSLINDTPAPAANAGDVPRNAPRPSAPVGASRPAPATEARQGLAHAAAPKPMPVPANIEAMGPACADAYRRSFREANARSLRLLSHPAARGRGISLGQLIAQDLDDAKIIARLPQEATDDEQRAKMRQAEISSMWDRAIARAFGQPTPTPFSSADIGNVWDRAIALNNPGHKPAASPSSPSGDAWDRAYTAAFGKR